MKMRIFLLLLVANCVCGIAQEGGSIISGIVTDGKNPIPDVHIRIENGGRVSKTNKSGKYHIKALEGDVILFSHVGMVTLEVLVEDSDKDLNVVMMAETNYLDNVTVKKTLRRTQKDLFNEYNDNPNLIKTKFGILNKETSGTALYILEEKNINKAELNILEVISNSFPSIRISPKGDKFKTTSPSDPNAVVYVRGLGSLAPAAYEVDGTLFTEPPFFLDVTQIDRIALIPGMAGKVKYGTAANGGLFVINTKTGNFSPKKGKNKTGNKSYAQNNVFSENALTQLQVLENAPSYLRELVSANTKIEALKIHQEFNKIYSSKIDYILDVSQYFLNYWKDKEFVNSLVESNGAVFNKNPVSLKALAYIYQTEGYKDEANEVYKKVFKLLPKNTQSYIDLAHSYGALGQMKKAVSIYARYRYLLESEILVLDKELHKLLEKDLNDLLVANSEEMKVSEVGDSGSAKNGSLDIRMVFECNDEEAEFTLQFVNPNGQYFETAYSPDPSDLANMNMLRTKSSVEFIIDDSMKGIWQINTKYKGNKTLTSTYLKATIYYNYGSKSQRKETKLFKMSLRNVNQQWFKVSNAGVITSN